MTASDPFLHWLPEQGLKNPVAAATRFFYFPHPYENKFSTDSGNKKIR
jgi:hypothetical protein